MHDCDDIEFHVLTPAEKDAREQHAVLNHILAEHPAQLTLQELTREFGNLKARSVGAERIEHSVNFLVGAGLLHRENDTIRPTRAALLFHQLSQRD